MSDASYVHEVQSFSGNGLRPYAPVHLNAQSVGGNVALSWIRQTRIDGDRWDLPEVPLGEDDESYRVRVWLAGQMLREVLVNSTS